LGVYVTPDLTIVLTSPFTQRPVVQYDHWPINAETTGNPGRVRIQNKPETRACKKNFSIGTVMGSKRKESGLFGSYWWKKADESDSYYGDIDPF